MPVETPPVAHPARDPLAALSGAELDAWFATQAWLREYAPVPRRGWPGVDEVLADPPRMSGEVEATIARGLHRCVQRVVDERTLQRALARQHARLPGGGPVSPRRHTLDELESAAGWAPRLDAAGTVLASAGVAAGAGALSAGTGGVAAVPALAAGVGVAVVLDAMRAVRRAGRIAATTGAAYGLSPDTPAGGVVALAVADLALAPRSRRASALVRTRAAMGPDAGPLVRAALGDGATGMLAAWHRGVVLRLLDPRFAGRLSVLGGAVGALGGAVRGAQATRHVRRVARAVHRERFLLQRAGVLP